MKILLIDNEPQVRNVLKNMVLNWSNGLHSIEDADGVASGIIAINSFVPDIVLLDVEMDDGSGFDLLKQIENHHFN
jgi:two-component system LytT family response regulator